MKILVIDDDYPSPTNLFANVFVHVRAKAYQRRFPNLLVASSFSQQRPDYVYEGVNVRCVGSIEALAKLHAKYAPDVTLVHFATFPIIRSVILKSKGHFVIWAHGFEAQGWFRRLYDYRTAWSFARYIKGNMVQLYFYRQLIQRSNRDARIHFVFVSEWIKRVTRTDCITTISNSSVIPNPIDDHLFSYLEKSAKDRLNFLLIRPFGPRKYATDLVTEAMKILASKPFFDELNFTVVGGGASQSDLAHLFRSHNNVVISEGFLTQAQIKELHDRNGVFLALTRQDTHGVSMCEAMASGLVPISSNNSAIPEYVTDGVSGLLTDNEPISIAAAIERLYREPETFLTLSQNAASEVRAKAGIDSVIAGELALIEQMAELGGVSE